MHSARTALVTILIFVFSYGCPTESRGEDPSGVDTEAEPGDTETGTYCGEVGFELGYVPVNLMLLIDRSGSMKADHAWPVVGNVLDTVLSEYTDDQFHFGYHVFPSKDDNCGISPSVIIDTLPGNAQEIFNVHDTTDPSGNTPLHCGMKQFLDKAHAPVFTSGNNEAYLVVLSDGTDTCGSGCPDSAHLGQSFSSFRSLTDELVNNGIRVVSIGLGGSIDSLDDIAAHGGTPLDEQLVATEQDTLKDAFTHIMTAAQSCTVEVDPVSVKGMPGLVNFYLDDTVIPYDQDCKNEQGWTWTNDENTQALLCDYICTRLRSRPGRKVKATFGCEVVTY